MKKFTEIYNVILESVSKNEILKELKDLALDELANDPLTTKQIQDLLPHPWQVYIGNYGLGRNKLEVVINVKGKGIPNFEKILKELGLNISRIENEEILSKIWKDEIKIKFDELKNETYNFFKAKDFIIIGRSDGWWGLNFSNYKQDDYFEVNTKDLNEIITKFLNSDEGKEMIKNDEDSYEIAQTILDKYLSEIKYSIKFKDNIINDLKQINLKIINIAKSLEKEDFWIDYLSDLFEVERK